MNLELSDLTNLAGQQAPGILFASSVQGLCLAVKYLLGIKRRSSSLWHQSPYQLSHLLNIYAPSISLTTLLF